MADTCLLVVIIESAMLDKHLLILSLIILATVVFQPLDSFLFTIMAFVKAMKS